MCWIQFNSVPRSRMVFIDVEDSGFELVYKIDFEMLFKVNYSILFLY